MKMSPVVHFEMPYEDRTRMVDFYSKSFGWKAQLLGADMGDYAVIDTSERDPETQYPKEPGRINGGFYKRTDATQYPSVVIAVDDIREAMKSVAEAGGEVLGGKTGPQEPDEIPGYGLYVSIKDTEGNRVGLIQPVGR